MQLSAYYQASIDRSQCGFMVAVLRSFEHLVFDRTISKASSRFEFFVPHELESTFVELMDYFVAHNIVLKYEKLPHRLLDATETV